jgi:hypothetical protein
LLRRHSSSIKPYLTDANKKTWLKWCVDLIEQGLVDDLKFRDFFDFVFIHEKWFYLSQKSEKYYLLPEEDEPDCTCKNKITSLGSCFCVFVLGQGLGMESVFLMGKLVVFHLSLMKML